MFRTFRSEVEAAMATALRDLGYPTSDLGIEEPPDGVEAVLASSVAYRLASAAESPPAAVAAELAEAVSVGTHEQIGSVVAEGPYINFHPSSAYYRGTVAAVDDDWGRLPATDTSVVVEHTSSNPTGPLHVGRLRNTLVGDAIARIRTFAGDDVTRHYYVNDAGRQMAVFTWAYEHLDKEDLPPPERPRPDYELVRYYRAGHAFLEEGEPEAVAEAEEEITALIRGMEAGEEAAFERVWTVVDQVLEGMKVTLSRLPAPFDDFIRETRFMQNGATADVVERLQASSEAERADGAWQLQLETHDIEKPFVFLRSDGTTLYTTRDLAHHEWKFKEYDHAITVLGEDQELHARQLRAALDILDADTDRLDEVFHSYVNLPGDEGMSTRRGTGIDADELIDEAIDRARNEVEQRLDDRARNDELDEGDIERIARQVGVGAVRFDIVAKQRRKEITFDWDQALDFEAQSAPYVQYAHARACGILAGFEEESIREPPTNFDQPAERALIETIARLPAVVEEAATELEPHLLATYVRELADDFNAFYRECPVQDASGESRMARAALVDAARHTLANGLWLLGVQAPESM
ncbi:MAG: arginine--tRNA ligase [Halobacteriaceae archaeon]